MKNRSVVIAVCACIALVGFGIWQFEATRADIRGQRVAHIVRQTKIGILKQRALHQRDWDDLQLLLGDRLPVSTDCDQVATSNYIEDKWTEIARANHCLANETLCDKEHGTLADQAKASGMPWMAPDDSYDHPTLIAVTNARFISQKLYAILYRVIYVLDPQGEINAYRADRNLTHSPELLAMTREEKQLILDEIDGYVASCAQRKPMMWSQPHMKLPKNVLENSEAFKLSVQALVMKGLLTRQLAAEDRGIVGCISSYNDGQSQYNGCEDLTCAENVPFDTKYELTVRLADLKEHQCSLSYAGQFISGRKNTWRLLEERQQ